MFVSTHLAAVSRRSTAEYKGRRAVHGEHQFFARAPAIPVSGLYYFCVLLFAGAACSAVGASLRYNCRLTPPRERFSTNEGTHENDRYAIDQSEIIHVHDHNRPRVACS